MKPAEDRADFACTHADHDRMRGDLAAFVAGTIGRYRHDGALFGLCARCTSTLAIRTTNGEETP